MKLISNIINKLNSYFSKDEVVTIKTLNKKIKKLESLLEVRENTIFSLSYDLDALRNEIASLNEEMTTLVNKEEVLKEFLDNSRPHKYSRLKRHLGKRLDHYCTEDNNKTPLITGDSYDDIANKGLMYIIQNFKYVSDGVKDSWKLANKSMQDKSGDCEDGSILLYSVLRKAGIPSHRLRLNAGLVYYNGSKTGHAYITYYSDKKGWVILDWCYYPNESLYLRKSWKTAKKYFSVWFSWNEEFVWEDLKSGETS